MAHVLDTVDSAVEAGLLAGPVVVTDGGRGDRGTVRRLALERGFTAVTNHAPERGLSGSLRLGLRALESLPMEGAVVLLGDQPRTRLDVIAALIREWRRARAPILVPRYRGAGGEPGNPVFLDRSIWPLARRLRGDSGMSAVVRRHPELVAYLDVEGTNPDVDRPADLERLSADRGGG